MEIREFTELLFAGNAGTFTVTLSGGVWSIEQVGFDTGYQVGVANVALVGLSRDGEGITLGDLQDRVFEAVSDFYYSNLIIDDVRYLGAWVEESKHGGDATLWLDKSVWVADQLSANIVGAVLGEKEIYDWANDKCLTVVKAGK
jgi:hypothetical protein